MLNLLPQIQAVSVAGASKPHEVFQMLFHLRPTIQLKPVDESFENQDKPRSLTHVDRRNCGHDNDPKHQLRRLVPPEVDVRFRYLFLDLERELCKWRCCCGKWEDNNQAINHCG